MWGWDGGFGAMAIVFGLVGVVFWGLVIVALVLGIRWLLRQGQAGPPSPPGAKPDEPLDILRQRYARGEIDDEEYDRRRKTLTGS